MSVYDFQKFEDEFVSNIGKEKFHTRSSMNMLDQNQYGFLNKEKTSVEITKTNVGSKRKNIFRRNTEFGNDFSCRNNQNIQTQESYSRKSFRSQFSNQDQDHHFKRDNNRFHMNNQSRIAYPTSKRYCQNKQTNPRVRRGHFGHNYFELHKTTNKTDVGNHAYNKVDNRTKLGNNSLVYNNLQEGKSISVIKECHSR